tara:strand:+ start:12756 stop:14102 length:1347 start_codon:yes stop_codon:yes gene_type:complete
LEALFLSKLKGSTSGLLARKAAWDVLQAVSAGAYADIALDRVLKKYSLNDVDRALTTEIAYGSIRQMKLLDSWVDYFGKQPSYKQPPLLRLLLHLGLYQILKMDRIPSSAAINTSVELAKGCQLVKLAPVVNGLLRAADRLYRSGKEIPLPEKISERLAQEQSLPIWLTQELIHWKGETAAESIAIAFNKVPFFDLRVNRFCSTPLALKNELHEVGIESNCIDGVPDGLEVNTYSGDVRKLPGYKQGKWCVQDRSSQWVAPLLEPCPHDRVLDACAAPGCKSTHLAELMNDQGEIWAVDRSHSRLKRVLENAARLGVNSINTMHADSSNLLQENPNWEGYFQRILVDAPCSGLGTLARNPDARWRMSPVKVEELVLLQAKLLKSVIPLLAPGGRLVYSTCTLHPKENCQQIKNLLSTFSKLKLLNQKQIWPNSKSSGDGFYIAVLELI